MNNLYKSFCFILFCMALLSGKAMAQTEEHEVVDLGLSVGWATCNVGAENPWEAGDRFAWGETAPKASYTSTNSAAYDKTIPQLIAEGILAADSTLSAVNDAARANWGGEWRMPSDAEVQELWNACQWAWKKRNGVAGYEVTGPSGGKIFLPAADYGRDEPTGTKKKKERKGYYWSATPMEQQRATTARGLSFGPDGSIVHWYLTFYGFSVRPVKPYSPPKL